MIIKIIITPGTVKNAVGNSNIINVLESENFCKLESNV